jgi:ribonuclease HII
MVKRRRGSTRKRKEQKEAAAGGLELPNGDPGVNLLLDFDNAYTNIPIAGIDEVGRGPLAGPLVAAAVILEHGVDYPGVDDSKKLSHEERVQVAALIKEKALDWTIVFKSPKEVDEMNPLRATLTAMAEAYQRLKIRPATVLVDGNIKPLITNCPMYCIVRGDSKSLSIAAASIIAKVARDEIMLEEHNKYPKYGFDRHKGYGTKEHLLALKHYGPCEIHRLSYRSVTPQDTTPSPFTGLGPLFLK